MGGDGVGGFVLSGIDGAGRDGVVGNRGLTILTHVCERLTFDNHWARSGRDGQSVHHGIRAKRRWLAAFECHVVWMQCGASLRYSYTCCCLAMIVSDR